MTEGDSRRPRPRLWAALAVALAVVAVVALVIAVTGQQQAPLPAAAAGGSAGSSGSSGPSDSVPGPQSSAAAQESPAASPPAEPSAPGETVAEPVSVALPAIGVESRLMDLGLNPDGTVEVPPLERDDKAGWYTPGPAPGEVGPAVILGHVDSALWGPGVFFELGALEKGDEISVARADGSVAVFAVDRVEVHRKDDFPTIEVYGNTDDPQLRLITCGGAFDPAARSYEDNVVVFASLEDIRPA